MTYSDAGNLKYQNITGTLVSGGSNDGDLLLVDDTSGTNDLYLDEQNGKFVMTYTFLENKDDVEDAFGSYGLSSNQYTQFTSSYKPFVQSAFQYVFNKGTSDSLIYFQDVVHVNFQSQAISAGASGVITIGQANSDMQFFEGANPPASERAYLTTSARTLAQGGDIWINTDHSAWSTSFVAGSAAYKTILEELSHSFGIDIYAPQNRTNSTLPYDASSNPLNASMEEYNNQRYTVTSYVLADGMDESILYGNDDLYAYGLMMFDIYALQNIYKGRNYTKLDGDTYHTHTTMHIHNQNTDAVLYTIWDGKGNDWLDAAEFDAPARIDLRQGEFSSLGVKADGSDGFDYLLNPNGDLKQSFFTSDIGNVGIAYFTVIENAAGTNDEIGDVIVGNAWNNELRGLAGDDWIFGDGKIYAEITTGSSTDADAGFLGTDEDIGVDLDSDGDATNDYVDPYRAWGTGNAKYADDYSGNDRLVGGAGNDHLYGGDGIDVADYENDHKVGGSGPLTAILNADGSVTSVIDGWADVDTLSGIEVIRAGLNAYDRILDNHAGTRDLGDWSASPSLQSFEILELSSGADSVDGGTGTSGPDLHTIDGGSGYDSYTQETSDTAFMMDGAIYTDYLKLENFNEIIGNSSATTAGTLVVEGLSAGHGSFSTLDYTILSHGVAIGTVPGTGFDSTITEYDIFDPTKPVYNFESDWVDTIYLTNSDDRVSLGGASYDRVIYLGDGDDFISASGSGVYTTEIYYTSGDDRIATPNHASKTQVVRLDWGIDPNDITDIEIRVPQDAYSNPGGGVYDNMCAVKYTIDNYGSITISRLDGGVDVQGNPFIESSDFHTSIVFKDGQYIAPGDPFTIRPDDNTWASQSGTQFDPFGQHKGEILDHSSSGVAVDVDGGYGIDTITGSNYDDTLYGNVGGDNIKGGDGEDTLIGGAGADRLYDANDSHSDTLIGGLGDDVIYLKGDIATGGAGADTFIVMDGSDSSLITDFDPGEDRLYLGDVGAVDALEDLTLYYSYGGQLLIEQGNFRVTLPGVTIEDFGTSNVIYGTEYSEPPPSLPDPVLPTYPSTPSTTLYGTNNDPYTDEYLTAEFATPTHIISYDGLDYIGGSDYDDILEGGADDDIVDDYGGNDWIKVGEGYDEIYLGYGDDIVDIVAATGYSNNVDIYTDYDSAGLDYIVLPSVYDTSSLSFSSGSSFDYTLSAQSYIYSVDINFNLPSGSADGVEYLVVQNTAYNLAWVIDNGFTYTHDPNPPPPPVDPNDVPFASDDDLVVTEGETLTGNIFDDNGYGPDFDPNGIGLIATTQAMSVPGIGYFSLAANGDFTLQTVIGVSSQTAQLSYDVEDADGNDASADIAITIVGEDNTFYSTVDDDILHGGLGNDTVSYEYSSSAITANLALNSGTGHGTDSLIGLENISGSAFADSITGDANDNVLSGNAGADTLDGGQGADTLDGGAGNDTLLFTDTSGAAVVDDFDGGADTDTVDFSGFDHAVWVKLDYTTGAQSQTRDAADLVSGTWRDLADLANIENITGTDYNDILKGDDNDNVIQGGAGADELWGGGGADTLDGGAGNDTIYGEEDGDILNGGDGNDTIHGNGGADTIDGGAGADTLTGSTENDTIHGGADNDTIYGGGGQDELYGDGGNDILYGEDDVDTIEGGADDDTLIGNGGNDILDGGTGEDDVYGGDDDDTMLYQDNTANTDVDFYDGGSGSDTIDLSGFDSAIWAHLAHSFGPEVQTRDGSDVTSGTWREIVNLLNVENVIATAYDDELKGDSSANTFTGGDGADKFFFLGSHAFNAVDTITDFATGDGDVLELSDLISGYTSGVDDITEWVQITDNGTDSTVAVDADGTANGTNYVTVASLLGATGLTDEAALESSGNLIAA